MMRNALLGSMILIRVVTGSLHAVNIPILGQQAANEALRNNANHVAVATTESALGLFSGPDEATAELRRLCSQGGRALLSAAGSGMISCARVATKYARPIAIVSASALSYSLAGMKGAKYGALFGAAVGAGIAAQQVWWGIILPLLRDPTLGGAVTHVSSGDLVREMCSPRQNIGAITDALVILTPFAPIVGFISDHFVQRPLATIVTLVTGISEEEQLRSTDRYPLIIAGATVTNSMVLMCAMDGALLGGLHGILQRAWERSQDIPVQVILELSDMPFNS